MKKYKVIITPEALDDIINISNYIFSKSKNKFVAQKIYDLLVSSCNSLNILPYIYQIIFDDIRRVNIKWYWIFYEILEKENIVII